ncbi:lysophospholipase [Anaerosalibacter bizertensis]|uniref:Lysophospholipase n=1 Tax=Anaerosalibacter bizertensis TaxID=932217 RepID=A0A9Q4ABZ6_9FIRM|nr:alpha/beta hydrolase [Anaerosalibacter bizertensis]MBV1818399.1 lysophospholipase [Bacteroidales bacterium MSK.15.36]MBU5293964.1 lysophospholipase [Anaerosalibacter bizertensis]MCB5559500.1 alpha/beta hydrolase [Anaerosalibacter bizertensis]MCG4564557.1 lysophospholipase [Anaerosalibacter bizertensis]MCG4581722.1 lysophospholipase [Anaerosalibacter bizertensis]
MKSEKFTFKSLDNIEVFYKKWIPDDEKDIRACVQISHGMAEHIERYNAFAKYLVNNGFVVYGNDHRGHGKTAGNIENLGYFANENGWEKVVNDMYSLTEIIKDEHADIPIFIFGHSMGSFLTRRYIQLYGNKIEGVILSGTGGDPGIAGSIGIRIAKREIRKNGSRAQSPKLNKLSFGNFNKQFEPVRTEFDWLTRDEKEVDKYIEDPYCGGIFTCGFFYDMLSGLKELNKKENIEKIPKGLPIFLVSGDKDPVGNNTKGVLQAYNSYKNAEIVDVNYKFYTNARHEILNELNKKEVYKDIISWVEKHIKYSKSYS